MLNGFHSLLPVHAQLLLIDAAKKNLNETIKRVESECPYRYHTKDTLDNRVFFDQPRGPVGDAKFIHAAPVLFSKEISK